MELGPLSPFSDDVISSPEHFSTSPSPTSSTQSDIMKDSIGPMMTSDQEESNKKEAEKKKEESSFKQKLVEWLKSNNLKLAPKEFVELEYVDLNVNNVMLSYMNLYDLGTLSSP